MRKGILIGAIIGALVAGGTAAASGWLITSVNQIKPSVRNKLKGNRGPRGHRGFTGIKGPAGPSSLTSVIVVNGPTETVAADDVGSSLATCPGADTLIGGGYQSAGDPLIESTITDNYPLGNSWGVVLVNNDTIDGGDFYAQAICSTGGSSGLDRRDPATARAEIARRLAAARAAHS